MNPNWAEENLQTIRTLMERSALYRRALAPIMLFAGIMGVLAAVVGIFLKLDSSFQFGGLWLGTALVVVIGALLIARRQALKDGEGFWSPPTRRVAQALAPPLTAGLVLGLIDLWLWDRHPVIVPFIWALFYGCALHSAGFFMRRGVRLFGWIYIGLVPLINIVNIAILAKSLDEVCPPPHWIMGFFFGVLHLAYGAYLFFTEKGKNAA
ncbi:MAG TPA: hypothetical protein VH280_14370 [Verrucomicrobiae bacterium]|jgi:hypothetical protein|nr:hypothetical protein [Verrucomicrobiae bacterium]